MQPALNVSNEHVPFRVFMLAWEIVLDETDGLLRVISISTDEVDWLAVLANSIRDVFHWTWNLAIDGGWTTKPELHGFSHFIAGLALELGEG